MKQPLEKFQVNIQTTGNVSAASIPMALADLMKSGKIQPGDKIMLVGFGGGLSAGAVLFEAV
jgi:3-oxoacyl-[acyl-carrier-protein] synthase-3